MISPLLFGAIYFLGMTVTAFVAGRFSRGEGEELVLAIVILWPLFLPIMFFLWVYDKGTNSK